MTEPRPVPRAPTVSVLIPVYNRADLVRPAIESSIRQTYRDIEIVVVDNASTDETWATLEEYAKKDSRVRTYRNTSNLGPVGNWRRCLELAIGKYVKFLWSDDWMEDNFLEVMVEEMERDPSVAWGYSPAQIVSDVGTKLAYSLFPNSRTMSGQRYLRLALLEYDTPVSPGCALFRRGSVNGCIETGIPNSIELDFSRYGAGTDLLMMLLPLIRERGRRVFFSQATRCYFLHHAASFSVENRLKSYYEHARVYSLNLLSDARLSARYFVEKRKRSDPAIRSSLVNLALPHSSIWILFEMALVSVGRCIKRMKRSIWPLPSTSEELADAPGDKKPSRRLSI